MFWYGWELEIIGISPRELISRLIQLLPDFRFLSHHSPRNKELRSWGIGDDTSMGTIGSEIRSPIFEEGKGYEESIKLLRALKSIEEVKVSHKCGFHVHVSTDEGELDAQEIMKKLNPRIPNNWRQRGYCSFNFNSIEKKYVAVRQITNDHIEYRLYNASLNIRHAVRCIKLSLDSTISSLLVKGEPESISCNTRSRVNH